MTDTQPLQVPGRVQPDAARGLPGWVRVSRTGVDAETRPLDPRRIVLQLVLGLVAVVVVVAVVGTIAAQRLAEREAVNDAATTADVIAQSVIQPALTPELLDGDPAAVSAMDALVRERVLGGDVVRVKLWNPSGTVLYADEPELVGRTFTLSDDQREVLASPRTFAEVSTLDEAENEFEPGDRLVEVYRPVWTDDGTELLFEMYRDYAPVSDRAADMTRGFGGVVLSSLLLLVVLTAPIVWRLVRRLRAAQEQRELLLERAVDASQDERRRIAASLHDGPVQELVATSYAVAGAAARAESARDHRLASELSELSGTVRGSIRVLRTLLVDIYPPSLEASGLASALGDLRQTLEPKGVRVELDVDEEATEALGAERERLVYRVAQECLRNTAEHAAPCSATVRLRRSGADLVLEVEDDGPGFDTAVLTDPRPDHFGLRVLADVATDGGAILDLASAPGHGTRWRLSVPATEPRPGATP